MARIVGVVADVSRDREFRRLVLAEVPLKDIGGRGAPVPGETAQPDPCAAKLAERSRFARSRQPIDAGMNLLHGPEQASDTVSTFREPGAQRQMRGVEADRQIERLAD